MSSVDNRVVQMDFNNKRFEENVHTSISSLDKLKQSLNLDSSAKSLSNLENTANSFSLSGIASGVDTIAGRFSTLGIMGVTALQNITNQAINTGKRMVAALTIDPIKTGFTEYETKMNAIQTIMSNTASKGTTMSDVTRVINELNTYADKTIYNFAEMTKNIGTFTAAGVGLEDSAAAIQGIANLAAASGSSSQQASTAMYQLSQALSTGTVRLMDWNSVVNAGMGGEKFQEALKATAREHGVAVDSIIKNSGSFRDSLKEEWLSADILNETLKKFTVEGAKEYADSMVKSGKYTKEQADALMKEAQAMEDAATKVKTFTQLWDTLKESAQSGWAQSWELIIGDFDEAKSFLTKISDKIGGMISASADARNALLSGGLRTGWDQLLNTGGIEDEAGLTDTVKEIAKEHGVALDKIITDEVSFEESLKQGWLTSDILTESLQKYTDEVKGMSEEELKAAGYTQEYVEKMEKLAAGVKNGTISVEEFAEKMAKPSGRENVIDALRNSFNAIMSIVNPIKKAFSEIFHLDDVEATANKLYSLTERLKEFTSKLTIGTKTAENIKRTFKGLFALLSIGVQIVSAIAGGIMDLVKSILPAGDGILSITGNIGDSIVAFDEFLKSSGSFKNAISKIVGFLTNFTAILKKVVQGLADFVQKVKDAFNSFDDADGDAVGKFADNAEKRFNPLIKIAELIKKVFSALGAALKKVAEPIYNIINSIGDITSKIITHLLDAIKNADFNSLLDLVNTGMIGGLAVAIKKFFDTLTKVCKNSDSFGEKLGGILDGVKGALEGMQNSLKSNILLKIAIAIGILAAALVALSLIDSEKLAGALAAMTTMFIELFGSMAIFEKTMGGSVFGSMNTITSSMIKLAAAILILSFAMAKLAELDWNGIAKGLTAIGVIMLELVAFSKLMEKIKPSAVNTTGLIAVAIAVNILASAMAKIAPLNWEQIGKGLLSITGVLALLVAFTKAMGDSKILIQTGASMILIGVAMIVFAEGLERLGNLNWSQIGKGLLTMAGALAVVTVAMYFMRGPALAGAAAMLIVSVALMVLVPVLQSLAGMESSGKALLTLAGALIVIAVAMYFMTTAIVGALALLVVSAALTVFSFVLQKLAGMQMDEIGRALLVLAGSLVIIAAAMYALTYGIAGAAALLVITAALAVFVPILQVLASMSLQQLGMALLVLAGVFIVFGVAAAALSSVIVQMIGIAAALALLGVACMAVGIGVLAVSMGLAGIAGAGVAAAEAIVQMIITIIGVIPKVIEQIGIIITTLVTMITESLPLIVEMIKAVVLAICDTVITILPSLVEMIKAVIFAICDIINTVLPTVMETITNVLNALCELLITFIPKVLTILTLLLNGILALIVATTPGVVATVVTLLLCVIAGLTVVIPKLLELVALILTEVLKLLVNIIPKLLNAVEQILLAVIAFLLSFVPKLVESALELVVRILEAIAGKLDDVILAATAIALALIEGIVKTIPQVIDAATKMIIDVINGLANSIRENTPKMIAAVDNLMNAIIEAIIMWFTHFTGKGGEIVSKIISGIKTKVSEAKAVAKNLIGDVLQKIKDKIADFKTVGKDAISGLIKGIKDKASKAVEAAKGVVSDALAGAKKLLGIKSPSREFMKVGQFSDEGLVVGLTKYASKVKDAAGSVAQSALDTMSDTIGNISNILNGDVNTDPVIKPVLDLSNIRSGAKEIDSMLANQNTLSIDTKTAGTIAASMNSIQNGNNSSELASAIKGLRKDLANVSNNTYNINGVTYDDGSNITDAVATIVRAAKIGRRV